MFGAIGAVAPDIIILYSKRWTMPSFEFEYIQYVIVTLIYLVLAGVVAMIYPYPKKKAKTWYAFCIGVALPVILSAVISTQRGEVIIPRGVIGIQGGIIDLMSLF